MPTQTVSQQLTELLEQEHPFHMSNLDPFLIKEGHPGMVLQAHEASVNKVGQFSLIALCMAKLKCHSTGWGSCPLFSL